MEDAHRPGGPLPEDHKPSPSLPTPHWNLDATGGRSGVVGEVGVGWGEDKNAELAEFKP